MVDLNKVEAGLQQAVAEGKITQEQFDQAKAGSQEFQAKKQTTQPIDANLPPMEGQQPTQDPQVIESQQVTETADNVQGTVSAEEAGKFDLQEWQQVDFEDPVRQRGANAQVFMDRRNQSLAEETMQNILSQVRWGIDNLDENFIQQNIIDTIGRRGGQVDLESADRQRTVRDIQNRMWFSWINDINKMIEEEKNNKLNSEISGEKIDWMFDNLPNMGEAYKTFLENYLVDSGLSADVNAKHIDILGFYDREVNTEEMKQKQNDLTKVDAEIDKLQESKAELWSTITSNNAGVPKGALQALYNDQVTDINRELRALQADRNQLATDVQNIISNGQRMVDMYVQEETFNNDQDRKALGYVTDIAKTDWNAQWNMFEKKYFRDLDKQDATDVAMMSIAEKSDLMNLTDADIANMPVTDRVKTFMKFKRDVSDANPQVDWVTSYDSDSGLLFSYDKNDPTNYITQNTQGKVISAGGSIGTSTAYSMWAEWFINADEIWEWENLWYDPSLVEAYADILWWWSIDVTRYAEELWVPARDLLLQANNYKKSILKPAVIDALNAIDIVDWRNTAFGRWTSWIALFWWGVTYDAMYDFIKDNLTLNKLIEAKEKWATFGALSDNELQAIGNAAAALNKRMSNQEFEATLDTIRRNLTSSIWWVDPRWDNYTYLGAGKSTSNVDIEDNVAESLINQSQNEANKMFNIWTWVNQ